MAYICTPREIAGLRGVRKKSICALQPSWLAESGGLNSVDWEYSNPESKRHYSTSDDIDNGNVLPHVYGRPYFHISSNCSLPVNDGPNTYVILLQHNAQLGYNDAQMSCEIWGPNVYTYTGSGYIVTVKARLGFSPESRFSDMKVLRRNKPWLKVVGKFKVVKFKSRHEDTCNNVALVGTYDAFGNFIYPQYTTNSTILVDEEVENTITMTSFSEEFGTDSLDFNTSQNDATYTDPYGQVVTYPTFYMNETGSCSISETSIYATKL
jgi:hypothetical protein